MKFNVDKCKIMHVGRNNPRYEYFINGTKLKAVDDVTDVGVIVHDSLKPAKQCQKAANTAGAVLRTIKQNFHYRDKRVFVQLFNQYVRPHLEFAAPAWSPWLEQDKQLLESSAKGSRLGDRAGGGNV
jgi:predicted YcjX-like family ATPase